MKHASLFLTVAIAAFIFFNANETNIKYSPDVKVKNGGSEQKKPYEFAWIQKTYPYYDYDKNIYIEALERAQTLKSQTANKYLNKGTAVPQWEFAGPVNIGGRVVDIEFNPIEPSIVYAATATGGVFKSTDAGENWFPIFDDQASLTVGDIGVDPQNPDILYVGTGEANGGHNNFAGSGIFKSTNAGSTWDHIGLTNTVSIGRVVVDPSNGDIVYAAAVGSYFSPTPERGVYKSTDGGATWSLSLFVSDSTGAVDLIIDPNDSNFLMAAMWERVRRPNSSRLYGASSGIYISSNGGDSWTEIENTAGLPDAATDNVGRIGLAMAASNSNVIYALYNDGYVYSGLYKTTDKGASWVETDVYKSIEAGVSNFSWYFGQVRVNPVDPQTVYALDVAFMRSTDGGESFPLNYGYGGPDQLHVDHHALAFHPNDPNYLISGNDGGINVSTDGGVTWSLPKYLPATQFYEINIDYNNPERLYGGTQDNNTIRTLTGALDDWERILGGDGFYVIVDPTNPNVIYAEYQFGSLFKSTDGGYNFDYALDGINLNEPTNWSTPVVMDPNRNNVLYYGTDRIYRTTNGAASWSAISGDLSKQILGTRLGTVTTIAVAPSNSRVVYAGTDEGNVWVTADSGATWIPIDNGLPERWVTRVVVDPYDEERIFATFSGLKWRDPQPHVFVSEDMGLNWTDISGNLPDAPVNAFAIDNYNTDVLYLGSDVGAFVSFNAGESWEVLGEGMPVVSVYDLKIHPVENYLVAGTHGRSMYKIDLNEIVGVEKGDKEILAKEFELYQNYPNPFNPSTKIKFNLNVAAHVNLSVYNPLGEKVKTLLNARKGKGAHEVEWNGRNEYNEPVASGIYFYRLEMGDLAITKKALLVK